MTVLLFTLRASLACLLVAVQAFLVFTYGIEIGIPTALAFQCALQLGVAVVAPHRVRIVAAAVAAWVSVAMAVGLVISWVTVVIPVILVVGGFKSGDFAPLMQLVVLTLYLVVPAGIVALAFLLDDWEGAR